MRKHRYPSDVGREQFEQIGKRRKRTKPRAVELYEVWCAMLYLLKTGCQWRLLPSAFPRWQAVHRYFSQWGEPDQDGVSVLERALKESGDVVRIKQGRKSESSF